MRISRRVFRFVLFAPIALLCFVSPNIVKANTYTATLENRDFYFTSQEPSTLTIRTYAQQYNIDSMLWVYDQQNNVVTSNDDYFGLDSFVSFQMIPGQTYRLRAGVCCGDPNRWYGNSYIIEPSMVPSNAPTTSTSTTTTTLAPYFNSVTNLTADARQDGGVDLNWNIPEQSNLDIYAYTVSFFKLENGIESGGWGVWTEQPPYSLGPWMWTGTTGYGDVRFKIRPGTAACFAPSDLQCFYGPEEYVDVLLIDPTPVTTTTTTTSTTTTSTIVQQEVPEWTTTTVLTPPAIVTTTEPVDEAPTSTSNPESDEPVAQVPQYAPEQEATTPEAPEVDSEEIQTTTDEQIATLFNNPITEAELENAVSDLVTSVDSPEELTAVLNSLFEQDLTDEQFSTVIDTVFSEPLSDENFSAAIDAVFSEPLSDEKFDAVIDAILDQPLSDEQFDALVGVLESNTVSEEQVAAAVDSIIELGVTEDQATELATSAKVLKSIDGDQATEIFAAVDISAVTPEEASQIVSAVQEAPTEVRESFEEEINVFQGAIDTYVPLGSSVPISTRRVIIGASALAIFIAPLPTSRRN